jgi:hypothetical protein
MWVRFLLLFLCISFFFFWLLLWQIHERNSLNGERLILAHSLRHSVYGLLTPFPLGCGKAENESGKHVAEQSCSPHDSQETERKKGSGTIYALGFQRDQAWDQSFSSQDHLQWFHFMGPATYPSTSNKEISNGEEQKKEVLYTAWAHCRKRQSRCFCISLGYRHEL